MKVKEDSEKVGLKLNVQKMKIMSSNAMTSWQIDGETMETVTDFIFLSSKIIADGNCSHEIKRRLLLGRKAMTNLGSILKSRDISLPTSQIYGFSSSLIWMLALDYKESWVPKNWCFWTMCWRRLLRVLWTAEIQPVHPKGEISSEYSLEGLMLKLKLQPLGHLMRRTNSLEKTLVVGKIEGGRRKRPQRMKWLNSITDLIDRSLRNLQ